MSGASGAVEAAFEGKRVVVAGLGLHGGGVAAARYFAAAGARVLVTDLRGADALRPSVEALRGVEVEWRLGEHRREDFQLADLVCPSPAVPPGSPFLEAARAAGAAVLPEMNLFFLRCKAPILAVTGSNGKSTTTELLGRMVEAAGARTFVGGNLGRPLLERLPEIGEGDRVVLELSSFQLEALREVLGRGGRAPLGAAVLNLTPNHLDRHGTMEAYGLAKRAIVEHQDPQAVAVLNAEDPRVAAFAPYAAGRVAWFALAPRPAQGVYLDGEQVIWRRRGKEDLPLLDAGEVPLPGRMNVANVCAAAATALFAGATTPAALRVAVKAFRALPARLESVREWRGVRFVNDTVSTTPESTVCGIEAMAERGGPLALIAGGSDKGTPFDGLARACCRHVQTLCLIGRTAPQIRAAVERAEAELGRGPAVLEAATLEEAVRAAAAATGEGGAVLLSPACASFDMFANCEERGLRFAEYVRALA